MKTEIVKAEDYGLEISKANELTIGLKVVKEERKLLIKEFEKISKLELTEENLPKFKELRLRIIKNRTQGINKWHKTNKEFFLTGGKFVDAIKNKESDINEQMEIKLMDAEKHFENLEKERIAKIQEERVSLLSEFVEDASERNLSGMDNEVWEAYLSTKKKNYIDAIQAELDAEKERQEKIKAEEKEQKRIRKENEKLKKEAEVREKKLKNERLKAEKERLERVRLAKIEEEKRVEKERKERIEREKLEAKLKSKLDAEIKAKEDEEARIQSELNKGDSDKVKDLIIALDSLKNKYTFKSSKNKKMYKNVGELIDKVTNYIKT